MPSSVSTITAVNDALITRRPLIATFDAPIFKTGLKKLPQHGGIPPASSVIAGLLPAGPAIVTPSRVMAGRPSGFVSAIVLPVRLPPKVIVCGPGTLLTAAGRGLTGEL
jgi:hypothetical protein